MTNPIILARLRSLFEQGLIVQLAPYVTMGLITQAEADEIAGGGAE